MNMIREQLANRRNLSGPNLKITNWVFKKLIQKIKDVLHQQFNMLILKL